MTTSPGQQPELPEWMKGIESFGYEPLDDRDAASLVLPHLDYDSQLFAIRGLLQRNRESEAALQQEITNAEEHASKVSGIYNDLAVDQWADRLHESVYQDAAHSMAAVGMLAPLMESIFYQAFLGIRQQFFKTDAPTGHARWSVPVEDQWDCHFVWSKGRRSANLVEGIMQLSDAVGLESHLPQNLQRILQALFEYRNKMFHCGFEWPTDERERFAKRLSASGWPAGWFTSATRGGAPWIFYLTDDFIKHCEEVIEQVVTAIGAYCKSQQKRMNIGEE